jgi:hypothetical protein
MSKHLALRAVLMALVSIPVAACGPDPAAPVSTSATAPGSPKPGAATSNNGASGILQDDPSGLHSGKVSPLKPPPPPLAASEKASGQEVGQDLASALNADQEMDVYATTLDKGNGIVASGAGNLLDGMAPYRLFEATATPTPTPDTGASGAVVVTTTPKSPVPTATPTPKAARTPLPSLAPKFIPRLDALASEEKRAKLVARAQELAAKLAQRAQKLPETKAIKAAAKQASWTANVDGTYSKRFETDVTKKLGGKAGSGHLTVEATVDDFSDTLVHHLARLELQFEKTSRSVTRELVVASDGSRHISFHLEEWDAAGHKRVVDFAKTLDLEGALTGTGSATRFDSDGKTLRSFAVTLSGTVDAPEAKAADANSKLEASVSLDVDGVAKAEVRDRATAASAELAVTGDAAPQDDATP